MIKISKLFKLFAFFIFITLSTVVFSQSYKYEIIESDSLSIIKAKKYVIKSQTDLDKFADENKLSHKEFKNIDFNSEMIIIISMGQCGSTGHSIKITKIKEKHSNLIVNCEFNYPGKNCVVGCAITYPLIAFKTKTTKKSVKFKESVKRIDCD